MESGYYGGIYSAQRLFLVAVEPPVKLEETCTSYSVTGTLTGWQYKLIPNGGIDYLGKTSFKPIMPDDFVLDSFLYNGLHAIKKIKEMKFLFNVDWCYSQFINDDSIKIFSNTDLSNTFLVGTVDTLLVKN